MATALEAPEAGLSPVARALRALATVFVAVLLTAGTLWGNDDEFPFGPFRMLSTSTSASGGVWLVRLEAMGNDGVWRPTTLARSNIGLNQAEVEGQIGRFEQNPQLLSLLSLSHSQLRPKEAPWIGLRLFRERHVLEDRRPTGDVERTVVAEWVLEQEYARE